MCGAPALLLLAVVLPQHPDKRGSERPILLTSIKSSVKARLSG